MKLLYTLLFAFFISCSTEPEDCAGVAGGNSYMDECGVCNGDNSPNTGVCDCNGIPNGDSLEDNCGTCDDDATNDCTQDCAGVWGGLSYFDECGICNEDSANDCTQDCAEIWGGALFVDECGVCGGDNTTCAGCDGVPNSGLVLDCTGDCGGDTTYDCGPTATIYDGAFLKDKYFFIDDVFKNQFYPLNSLNLHTYNPDYVVGDFEIYMSSYFIDSGIIQGIAYLNPLDTTNYSYNTIWLRLVEGVDYQIDKILGVLTFYNLDISNNAIAISYNITNFTFEGNFGDVNISTGTSSISDYENCINNSDPNSEDSEDCYITLKLIKDIDESSPDSPTWPLMFKNVYSLGRTNIQHDELIVKIKSDYNESEYSQNGNSFLSIFGLDTFDGNGNFQEGGDGYLDMPSGSIVDLNRGHIKFPTYLPFAYDLNCDLNSPMLESCLGNFNTGINDILPELDSPNNSPEMYYGNYSPFLNSYEHFKIEVTFINQN